MPMDSKLIADAPFFSLSFFFFFFFFFESGEYLLKGCASVRREIIREEFYPEPNRHISFLDKALSFS